MAGARILHYLEPNMHSYCFIDTDKYMKLLTQRQGPFLFMAQQAVWDSCFHRFLFSNPGGAMQKGVVKYCMLCSITVSWEMLIWEMHLFFFLSKPSPCSRRNITSTFNFLIANITLRSGPNKGWSWPRILDIYGGRHVGAWEVLITGVKYPMSSPQFCQKFFLNSNLWPHNVVLYGLVVHLYNEILGRLL